MTKDKQSSSSLSHDKGDDPDKDRAPGADPAAVKAGDARADKTAVRPGPGPDQSAAGSSERPEVSRPKRRWFAGTVAVLALLLALGGIGAGYWAWLQIDRRVAVAASQQRAQLSELSDSVTALEQSREVENLQTNVQTKLSELEKQIVGLSENLAAVRENLKTQRNEQAQLHQAVKNVQKTVGNSQRDWMLAEVEYLMRVAQHRLNLARDIESAIAALKAADERLAQLGDPLVIPVRKALAKEINALESFSRPDQAGAALKLEQIISGLAPPSAAMPAPEGKAVQPVSDTASGQDSWRGFLDRLWQELSQHITVRRNGQALAAPPKPETQVYAQQMLRLRLEAARLAALGQDGREYHRQLDLAREWVAAHYEGEAGQQITDQLKALDKLKVSPALPEIGEALIKLRQYENRIREEG